VIFLRACAANINYITSDLTMFHKWGTYKEFERYAGSLLQL